MFIRKPTLNFSKASPTETPSKIYRAFLIWGGTREERLKKMDSLDDKITCSHFIEDNNKLVFLNHDNNLVTNITFDEAKQIAGDALLGKNFKPSLFGSKSHITRGVINLSDESYDLPAPKKRPI